jgi:5-methylcytosine-specific restriction enzyme subunit McrC
MSIPVLNIYYLLSYAWNKLDEADKIRTGISDYDQIADLFARLLNNGCNLLFKQGLDRDYINKSERYNGIKGKIDFAGSINANLFREGKAICEFDELEPNVVQNQILKATLWRLSNIKDLDAALRKEVVLLYWRFQGVDHIELRPAAFNGIRIHRNNAFYELLLWICRMVYDSSTLSEESGEYIFKDFIRDNTKMPYLFQQFVKNFYDRELPPGFNVSSPKVRWDAKAVPPSGLKYLPDMQTDICVQTDIRKIIIDTKFYQDTTSNRWGAAKFHSSHLYQLYAYLKNLEADKSSALNQEASGLLLYPTVNEEFDECYYMSGHKVRIATVDLGKEWQRIDARLRYVISGNTGPLD